METLVFEAGSISEGVLAENNAALTIAGFVEQRGNETAWVGSTDEAEAERGE